MTHQQYITLFYAKAETDATAMSLDAYKGPVVNNVMYFIHWHYPSTCKCTYTLIDGHLVEHIHH